MSDANSNVQTTRWGEMKINLTDYTPIVGGKKFPAMTGAEVMLLSDFFRISARIKLAYDAGERLRPLADELYATYLKLNAAIGPANEEAA